MKWYHALGIRFLDLLIIAMALVWVSLQIGPGLDWQLVTVDSFEILAAVGLSYIGCVIFLELLLLPFAGLSEGSRWARITTAILSTGFLLWLYPKVLWGLLFLMGQQVAADVEFVLLVTSAIRAFIRGILGRRWEETAV